MNNAHTFNPFLCLNTIHNGSQAAVLVGCGLFNPADALESEPPKTIRLVARPLDRSGAQLCNTPGARFRSRVWTRIRPRLIQNTQNVKQTWSSF